MLSSEMTAKKNKKMITKESIEKVFAAGEVSLGDIEYEFGSLLAVFPDELSDEECFQRMIVYIETKLAAENQKKLTELLSLLEGKE